MVPNRTARPSRPAPGAPGSRPADDQAPTPGEGEDELDPRKAAILNAVVSEYIETAEPVGSAHITGNPGVQVSSATVRSDMAALERDGYLTQPHTSAGRIPTDKGYRFFVDTLGTPGTLGPVQRQEVRRFFAHVHGAVEDLLGHTSGLLANLTDYAAVVVGPTHDSATIRSVQLVDLGPNRALLVVVLSDGAVEKRPIELPGDIDDTVLAAAAGHMTAHLRGRTLADPGPVPGRGDPALDTAVRLGAQALGELASADEPEHVFVGGSSRMASAFDAVETVRSVLSILEQQLVVVELVEHILDRGLSVAIGSEHGFEPLASCALVLAPVSVDGETAGTIGVVGPTRMNYPRALAAVQVVGERLGERLGSSPSGEGGREAKEREAKDPATRPGGATVAVDYYALLGVTPTASDDEIKRAYRTMARELHPDTTGGDATAEAQFKEVTRAYETLRDPERRARYDRFGPDGVDPRGPGGDAFFGGGGGLGDIFDAFFGGAMRGAAGTGGPVRGADAEVVLELDFRQAVFGSRHDVQLDGLVACTTCEGSGARAGTTAMRCPDCQGTGELRRVRQSILGQVVTAAPCRRCQGLGEAISSPCPDCAGDGRRVESRTFAVDVPAGVDHGSTLRLTGRGPAGPRGGPAGDLYVHLAVRPDARFVREGTDVHADLHVTMTQAALGSTVVFETLDGDESLPVPAGTQGGRLIKLRGRGVPHVRGRGRGDLLIHVVVDTPTELTKGQEELLRQLAAERSEEISPPDEGLMARLRSAFG